MAAAAAMQQDSLIQKVKRLIIRKGGTNGIRGLSRCFRIMDDNQDMSLDEEELRRSLTDFGLTLSDADINTLIKCFDVDGDGKIAVPEFLAAFRVGLHPKRKAFISRVFRKFDQNGDGNLDLEEFRNAYNAAGHPDVLKGAKSEEEVLVEFFKCFDSATNPDGVISKQEFEQHYSGVSASIANDDQFIALLSNTWNLSTGNDDTSHWAALSGSSGSAASGKRLPFAGLDATLCPVNPATYDINQKEQAIERAVSQSKAGSVVAKVKQYAKTKIPTQYHGLGRVFRKRDLKGDGFLDPCELASVFKEVKLHYYITSEDRELLIQEYDTLNGTFDYISFLNAITGDLPPIRAMLLERTWRRFPRNRSGKISLTEFQNMYIPDMVPEVAHGKKSKGEALSDFLDYWDARYFPSAYISYDEFELYYSAISEDIASNAHFATMIKVSWAVWEEEAQRLITSLLNN